MAGLAGERVHRQKYVDQIGCRLKSDKGPASPAKLILTDLKTDRAGAGGPFWCCSWSGRSRRRSEFYHSLNMAAGS
jgi:hypothetical protein